MFVCLFFKQFLTKFLRMSLWIRCFSYFVRERKSCWRLFVVKLDFWKRWTNKKKRAASHLLMEIWNYIARCCCICLSLNLKGSRPSESVQPGRCKQLQTSRGILFAPNEIIDMEQTTTEKKPQLSRGLIPSLTFFTRPQYTRIHKWK